VRESDPFKELSVLSYITRAAILKGHPSLQITSHVLIMLVENNTERCM